MTLTHSQLVEMAARHARHEWGSEYVATEPKRRSGGEEPDVVAWGKDGQATVVECKASASDYRSDHDKPHRGIETLGMGAYRYYLIEKADDGTIWLPEQADGWGILAYDPRTDQIETVVEAPHWPLSLTAVGKEKQILLRAIRQAQRPKQNRRSPQTGSTSREVRNAVREALERHNGPLSAIEVAHCIRSNGLQLHRRAGTVATDIAADARQGAIPGVRAEGTPANLYLENDDVHD